MSPPSLFFRSSSLSFTIIQAPSNHRRQEKEEKEKFISPWKNKVDRKNELK